MTGRMYLQPVGAPLPKHAAVVLQLGTDNFVFEDTRYFGRLTLDTTSIQKLGPEPLGASFSSSQLYEALRRSRQPIKVKLLDQSLVAGVGNIYASEALFRAQISPRIAASRLSRSQVDRLWFAVREVLSQAIAGGSTVPLDFSGQAEVDRLFYFGQQPDNANSFEERLRVYDRAGQACGRCGTAIKRVVQAARSTFYCPQCQKSR
jgi:formamidopyrimidine-DNA glycosylase